MDLTNLYIYYAPVKSMNVSEVKTGFSSVVDLVEKREIVVICKRNLPVAKLVSLRGAGTPDLKHRTVIGWAKGTGAKILGDLTEPALSTGDWDMMK